MFYSSVVPGKPSRQNERGRAFNLADLFEIVVDAAPDRTALVAGAVRHTYAELDERASRFGHHLLDAGVGAGDAVAILSWNRAEWVEAELGIYKARASVINVNFRYVADELRYMLENSDAVALVFERAFAPMVAEVAPDAPKLRHFVVIDDGSSDDASAKAVAELGAIDFEAALAAATPGPASPRDRATTSTSSIRAARPACPRVSSGVPRTSSSRRWVAGATASRRSRLPTSWRSGSNRADGIVVNIVNAPMMHGGGQWASFIGFFGGNTIVLNCDHHFDGERVCPTGRARARHVDHGRGRCDGAPAGRRDRPPRRRLRPVVASPSSGRVARSSRRRCGRSCGACCPTPSSWTASARRRPGTPARCWISRAAARASR